MASRRLFGSSILNPLSLVSVPQESQSYVIRTGGFIARFDRGSNVELKFALDRDKAVANATAVSGYKRAQSNVRLSRLQDQRSQGVGSISHRVSLVLYFVLGYRHDEPLETTVFTSSSGR